MKGHRARFRENGDLCPWRGSAAKKKPNFFIARALMTREIMRSRDAQYWGITLRLLFTSKKVSLDCRCDNRSQE